MCPQTASHIGDSRAGVQPLLNSVQCWKRFCDQVRRVARSEETLCAGEQIGMLTQSSRWIYSSTRTGRTRAKHSRPIAAATTPLATSVAWGPN